jgi:hypothetical protein
VSLQEPVKAEPLAAGATKKTNWVRFFTWSAIVLFFFTLARVVYLHWEVHSRPCDDISAQDKTTVTSGSAPSVVNFFPDKISLGSPLCVVIAGPANVAIDKDGQPAPLHLFLDGLELKGSVGALVDRKKNLVEFDVARTTDDSDVWSKIIGQFKLGWWGAHVPVHVGVGTDKQGEFDNATQAPLELLVVDFWAFVPGALTFLTAVLALVFAAQTSAILRDGAAGTTYSLARVQMAFWLYLITAAFIFIWLVTGDYNGVLSSQTLTLMGISGTTALMGISVDKATTPAPPPTTSQGFLNDILNENGGVALHRLQIVVWTAILGVVFFFAIYRSFRLPEFDSNLLILMGISGVTYAGFKFQGEK